MGRKALDLTGQRFGRLVAEERVGSRHSFALWRCRCDCGETTEVTSNVLRKENTRSCGCLQRELAKNATNARHGGKKECPVEYSAWNNLRRKRECPPEWDDFTQFFCDVGERPSRNHFLSVRDVTEPHSKHNTYWRNLADDHIERRVKTVADFGREFSINLEQLRANAATAAAA